jgi:hypothetical protein
MPRRQWKLRLRHILDAMAKIRVYTAGRSLETFSANNLVVDAVLRSAPPAPWMCICTVWTCGSRIHSW